MGVEKDFWRGGYGVLRFTGCMVLAMCTELIVYGTVFRSMLLTGLV
jgi:hypothetical protein